MTTKIATDDASVTALVRDVLTKERDGKEGRTSYLRLLVAAIQVALGASPRLVTARGRTRKVDMPEALAAFAEVNARFYEIVLAELPRNLDPLTRNAQSGFARSAASTLRSAIHAGLNPLDLVVTTVTKDALRTFASEHATERPMTLGLAVRRAKSAMHRMAALLDPLTQAERHEVIETLKRELVALEEMDTAPPLRKAA